ASQILNQGPTKTPSQAVRRVQVRMGRKSKMAETRVNSDVVSSVHRTSSEAFGSPSTTL
ncbi:hypothetical protein Tco_0865564, partial [Tanacetum coccineum]